MNQPNKRAFFIFLAGIILLAACAPAPAAPTQDPAIVQQQIQESVALTIAAQNAQAEQAQALIPATNTPLPTQTAAVVLPSPTPLIPTATPFVVVPPTLAPSTGGGSVSVVREFACDIIRQRPFDNTSFKPKKAFDIKWTIVNTGTRSWVAGLDLKYFSGPSMTTTTRIQLPAMAPGDQFDVVLDATSPSTEGFHVLTWVIDGQFCFPYVAINVEK